MAPQLTLFIFIIGLKTSFPVTIETSKTVGILKKSILEERKNRLKGVDIDDVTLYHVELPDDKMLEQSAALVVKDKESLPPSRRLFKIFPTAPPDETINIVVQVDNINNTALDDALVHSDLIREYEPFFIKVGRWGKFEHADIQRNNI
ncbi:hypothetical protein BC827DRAFT_725111 [Russula dissimulans]|nr:hypothetical protein BC827DRAFT_725111 [Russula dissimulans]